MPSCPRLDPCCSNCSRQLLESNLFYVTCRVFKSVTAKACALFCYGLRTGEVFRSWHSRMAGKETATTQSMPERLKPRDAKAGFTFLAFRALWAIVLCIQGSKAHCCAVSGCPTQDAGTTSSAGTSMKVMLAGGMAGAFSKTCTAPFGRMTILYQLGMLDKHRSSIVGGMRHVVASQVQLFTTVWCIFLAFEAAIAQPSNLLAHVPCRDSSLCGAVTQPHYCTASHTRLSTLLFLKTPKRS